MFATSSVKRLRAPVLALAAMLACTQSPTQPMQDNPGGVALGTVPKPVLTQGNGVVQLELFQICSAYSNQEAGPPVIVDVSITGSTTSEFSVTVQPGIPGGCQNIWVNPASNAVDIVTVTDEVPNGFTVQSALTTVVRHNIPLKLDDTTHFAPSSAASATGPVGGSLVAGSLVVFTHTRMGEIGDLVWLDRNGDGIQNAGEPGIPGATVTLTGPVSSSTVTTETGGYLFQDLPAGTYTVTVAPPAGLVLTTTSATGSTPDNDSNGSPATVVLAPAASDRSVDFGFHGTGVIGDFVWLNKRCNGIQDPFDEGLAGAVVTLHGPVNATQTTGPTGAYLFTDLPPGTYTVNVVPPPGYLAAPVGTGSDRGMDSNDAPATVVLAQYGSADRTIDFGFGFAPDEGPTVVPIYPNDMPLFSTVYRCRR